MTRVSSSARQAWSQNVAFELFSADLARHVEKIAAGDRTRINDTREVVVTATHEHGDGFVELTLPRTGTARWRFRRDGTEGNALVDVTADHNGVQVLLGPQWAHHTSDYLDELLTRFSAQ